MTLMHASCVAVDGQAVLLRGKPGSGKSDLAIRLIDRGATLVGDDYVELSAEAGRLFAEVPDTIAGRLELRGIGLVSLPHAGRAPVALLVDLVAEEAVDRLPEVRQETIEGVAVPAIRLNAAACSAPVKVEFALRDHVGV